MRIVSDFRDYYDCVQSYGQDQSRVWVRNKDVQERAWPYPTIGRRWYWTSRLGISQFMVGFCGRVYPALRLSLGDTEPFVTVFNTHEFDRFVECNFKHREFRHYATETKNSWKTRKHGIGILRCIVEKFFTLWAHDKDSHSNLFLDAHCPIFVAKHTDSFRGKDPFVFHGAANNEPEGKDVSWATLREMEFYRLFDTYTAFQEIQMYTDGVLGFSNPHVPVPDDKTLAEVKGFDKHSFRREPRNKK